MKRKSRRKHLFFFFLCVYSTHSKSNVQRLLFYFLHAYSFYLTTSKFPEAERWMPIVLEKKKKRGRRWGPSPNHYPVEGNARMKSQAGREITGFYKSYNRKTIRPFLDISYAKKHKGRWRMAKGKKSVFFFLSIPIRTTWWTVKYSKLRCFCVELTITTKLHIPCLYATTLLHIYTHTFNLWKSN